MTSEAKKVFDQALALSEEDRAALLDALAESLRLRADALGPEWTAEIARRIEAVERGESSLIPSDEVESRIRATLREI